VSFGCHIFSVAEAGTKHTQIISTAVSVEAAQMNNFFAEDRTS